MNRGYSVKAKANKQADIYIYEEIGDGWYGGVSARQFAKDLRDLGDLDQINLKINSPGGNVFDGNAIYNLLKQHKARVIVSIDGLAASIASVVAMAGDEITIAENALMMVHNAWGFAIGNAKELREVADTLDKVNDTIVATYLNRTRKEEAEIRRLMDAETWMSATEAIEHGFADKTTAALEMAAFDMSRFKYRNIPKMDDADKFRRTKLARMDLVSQRLRAAGGLKK